MKLADLAAAPGPTQPQEIFFVNHQTIPQRGD
ncbi:hypothetical protein AG0111_0g984 [Alternaria gaisen]|uniref:Uncharacterized protein n=1 Tax=Alternaria gaisen TaxID=167740 RepID=A0ACB6G0C5_9PLEO|nr:hypothetical protein AG0111_0g984 [Alternaria gaisen]